MVRIAGVPVSFGTTTPADWDYAYNNSGSGLKQAGKSVSIIPGKGLDFGRTLQEDEAIIESDTVTVFLASRQHIDSTDTTDPGYIFGRLGFESADFHTQLIETVEHENAEVIKLASVAGLQTGDIVHIGREAIEVGVIDAGAKTFVAARRGAIATIRRRHRVSADEGVFPAVTKPAVFFRGRRAIIYEARLGPNGEAPSDIDWVERFRGHIANEPEFSVDGSLHVVKLEISPLTAVLERPMASSAGTVRLHPRIHTFDGVNCNTIEVFETAEEGEYFSMFASELDANGNYSVTGVDHVDDIVPYSTLNPRNHIRRTPIQGHGQTIFMQGTGTVNTVDVPNSRINLYDDAGNAARVGGWRLDNIKAVERRFLPVSALASPTGAPVAKLWPEYLQDAVADTWTVYGVPGSLGSDSLWYGRVRYEYDAATSRLTLTPNFSYGASTGIQDGPGEPKVTVTLTGSPDQEVDAIRSGTPTDYSAAHVWINRAAADNEMGVLMPVGTGHKIPQEVIDYMGQGDGGAIDVPVTARGGQTVAQSAVEVPVKVAKAFYCFGVKTEEDGVVHTHVDWRAEKYITFEADPGVPAGGQLRLNVFLGDDDDRAVTMVVGPATSVITGGQTGYRCEVLSVQCFTDDIDRAIVDDGGTLETRPAFRAGVEFAPDMSPGEMILQLLMSADGKKITSSDYDVLPIGAALTDIDSDGFGSDVDAASFLGIPSVPQISLSPIVQAGDNIWEIVGSLLLVCGYAMDLAVTEVGSCKLMAVPIGLPSASEVLKSLTDADIAAQPVPSSPSRPAIRNLFKFESNYDDKGEAQFKKTVKDTVSIDTFGEADSLTLELKGATMPVDPGTVISILQPVFTRLRIELSYPRRLFRFNVRAGMAARMRVGGAYKVTSSQLRGTSGVGVSGAVCRLRSIEGGGFDATARAEFIYYGFAGAGWAPSVGITNINGAILTVTEDAFRPDDTVEDLTGFTPLSAGDYINVIDGSDPDAGVLREIVSTDTATNQITINLAPGIAAPTDGHPYWGYVVPAVKSSAADPHKDYGWIGTTRLT